MDDLVIVALPAVDERVNRISSEKIPHLTLLKLAPTDDIASVVQFVQHAAKDFAPFGLSVDYRGPLGPEDADVLFFEDNRWDLENVKTFRNNLLMDNTIKRLYDSTEQFPEWVPHLTLGYPATPAHEDTADYPGIHHVSFNRVAVWTGNYEGPEFRLKYPDHSSLEVSMSDTAKLGEDAIKELFHYGVKGMKWGVRKDETTSRGGADSGPTAVVVSQKKPGKFAKAEGGARHPLHPDAEKALQTRQQARKSTTDSLSNAELQSAIQRMQLEQRFDQLEFSSDRRSAGRRFVAGLFGRKKPTKYRDLHEQAGEQTADQVKKAIAARAALKAAAAAA